MPPQTAPSLPPGLYRSGSGFSAGELQVMVHEGAVRPLLGDLYACSALPDAPSLRAQACRALLSGSLHAHAVLCGQSAAWVHLGVGSAPERITVITAGVYRRRTAGAIPWQVHQVPLGAHEQLQLQGVPVTTALRTATDLFLGIGTVQSRRALDAPSIARSTEPTPHPGPVQRAGSAQLPGAPESAGCAERWALIRELRRAAPEQIQLITLLRAIDTRRGGRDTGRRRGQEQLEALLQARIFDR
ncbi:hypothetical protein I2485_12290 [Nesterenkonia sp. E16_7]|uniref:hypothetical protein n=1 Tax=unclassified Nesterenkonia TaxID=2629769 RepID=UPI001A91647C|nr:MULTISPECIES: hypothetical protein [unclassified Nesterenkonia]MBO0595979.1 hypothetical protein [Nesterenkonia sp. E16_10]MBO0599421.1 hypothetical protein [Nesterenkonia sp. E16_7]